jgi:hypothetical protein
VLLIGLLWEQQIETQFIVLQRKQKSGFDMVEYFGRGF